jgi:ketosteroid isomerase-like protein
MDKPYQFGGIRSVSLGLVPPVVPRPSVFDLDALHGKHLSRHRGILRWMTQENVEIVRRSTESYSRGDVDGTLETWAPDAVLDWSNSRGLEAGVVRGRGEIRRFMRQFLETFEEVRIEVEGLVEVKEGVVLAENLARFRGRDGIEIQARSAWLITLQGGQQTSLTLYQTKAEALEAVGLPDSA